MPTPSEGEMERGAGGDGKGGSDGGYSDGGPRSRRLTLTLTLGSTVVEFGDGGPTSRRFVRPVTLPFNDSL